MIVKCIRTELESTAQHLGFSLEGQFVDRYSNITLGREYVVFAIMVRRRVTGFIVLATRNELASQLYWDEHRFPEWIPSFAFEIVDGTLSRHWSYGQYETNNGGTLELIAWNTWHASDGYLAALSEECESVEADWAMYRRLIEEEATGLCRPSLPLWLFHLGSNGVWKLYFAAHDVDAIVKDLDVMSKSAAFSGFCGTFPGDDEEWLLLDDSGKRVHLTVQSSVLTRFGASSGPAGVEDLAVLTSARKRL